jgi:hypothetical protein
MKKMKIPTLAIVGDSSWSFLFLHEVSCFFCLHSTAIVILHEVSCLFCLHSTENMAFVLPPSPLPSQVDAFVAKHKLGESARTDLFQLFADSPKMYPFGQGALKKIIEISGPEVAFYCNIPSLLPARRIAQRWLCRRRACLSPWLQHLSLSTCMCVACSMGFYTHISNPMGQDTYAQADMSLNLFSIIIPTAIFH